MSDNKLEGGKGSGGQRPHWEVKLDTVNQCSKGVSKKVVWVGRLAKLKIDILMKKFKNQEWFAYLLGENFRIKDVFLPEQRASSAFVGNIECSEYNKLPVVGAIHSHHGMSLNMSGHDHDFVNSNHNISLLVNRQGISGQVRIKVPCGALYITDADVRLDLEVEFDKKQFMEEIDEKINKREKEKYVPSSYNYRRTFPSHHEGCTCTQCVNDRRDWLNKKNKPFQLFYDHHRSNQNQKATTWDTGNGCSTKGEVLTAEVEFEGAWICEECSRINYENDEKLADCVWCQSPRDLESSADEELSIKDPTKELEELEELLTGSTVSTEVEKAMEKRCQAVLEDISDEKILQNATEIISKYLVLVKQVYDADIFKKQLDIFIDILATDWNESEKTLRDDIEILVKEKEEQLEEKNSEK